MWISEITDDDDQIVLSRNVPFYRDKLRIYNKFNFNKSCVVNLNASVIAAISTLTS